MLPLDASPEELRTIGAALRRLGEVEPVVFSKLFDPLGPRARTHLSKDAAEAAAVLGRFGLLQEKEGAWEGRHRIRRRGDRFYVMEVGDVPEYHQDVWPETDAMLEVLERTPPGRVLDMGTGTGIVAIEAAARGHRVVATDLFAATLTLALFNAAINGLDDQLELRQGHLFEPVAGETFDLILTAPHYTRIADQLRLEALRTGPAHVAPGGRLVVATFLSWRSSIDGDDGPLAEVETLLKPLVDKGMSVDVAPIVATLKREWFARATVDEPGEFARGLLSRHRFLVTIKLAPLAALGDAQGPSKPEGGALTVRRPEVKEQLPLHYVPLARLRLGPGAGVPQEPRMAVLSTEEDVARLVAILDALEEGVLTLSGPLPGDLLDSCRLGTRRCVEADDTSGAAGAILDVDGGVRPCAHGKPIARFDDSYADVLARQRALYAEAEASRGCATCIASWHCSRCLFPGPLEGRYCDFMRKNAGRLPMLHRFFDTLRHLAMQPTVGPTLRLKRKRAVALVAAKGRPYPVGEHANDWVAEQLVKGLAERWRERETWLAVQGDRCTLLWSRESKVYSAPIEPGVAAIGELIADGATAREIDDYVRTWQLDELLPAKTYRQLFDLWG